MPEVSLAATIGTRLEFLTDAIGRPRLTQSRSFGPFARFSGLDTLLHPVLVSNEHLPI